jgi:Ca2+-binding RTX toxin-like protein
MQQRTSTGFWRLAVLAFAPIPLLAACSSSSPVGSTDDNSNIGTTEQKLIGSSSCPAGYTIIEGTSGDDVIDASGHTESVCILGNGGNDTITGGSNADFIAGGLGNDTINGGPGNDTIHGEDGDDTINGGDGDDVINGEVGNDTISGDAGNDYIDGSWGNDTIFGGAGDDKLYGSQNDDTIHGDDGNDQLFGGPGSDTLEGGNGNDTLEGDDDNDHLWGDFINNTTTTTGNDLLHGNAGDDDLHGGDGNDVLYGDTGNDTLNGDDGDDRLNGGTSGTKTISGGNGNDLAKGNGGTDMLSGDNNNDVLVLAGTADGGPGTDACNGTSCELPEPASFCTSVAGQCASGQRCALEVNVCIFCQSDSECPAGVQCIPTEGCATKELVCNDGIDNDGNGLTDCADPACAQALNCQSGVSQTGNSGVFHVCISNASGQVKCWGRNNFSQLGYYPPTQLSLGYSSNPTVITNSLATTPLMVRGGVAHTCALLTSGAVQCWGGNTQGQLGNGVSLSPPPSGSSITPVNVTGLSGVTQLSSGGNFNCAIVSGGAVKCWGENNFGQLGNGSTTNSSTPVSVSGLSGAVELKAGIQHACARLTNGTVMCWGRNHVGELGDGSTTNSSVPVAVTVVGSVAEISSGAEFSCGRRASGQVFCWGRNNSGQLGIGTMDFLTHGTPVQVSGISDAVEIGSGWYHSCIKRATQGLRCWGRNDNGQIGNGSTVAYTNSTGGVPTPTATSVTITDATQFSMGQIHSCVRRSSGSMSCWGDNGFGQMGDGTSTGTDRTSPFTVPMVP